MNLSPTLQRNKTRKRLRPGDWGVGMTACVAAFALGLNAIVIGVDQMLTVGGDLTSDMSEFAKGMRVHSRWYATYAGGVDQTPQIMSAVTNQLARYEKPRVEIVTDVFVRSYKKHRDRLLLQGMAEKDFDTAFLVAGFDSNDSPRIFTVAPPGVEGRHDFLGFWAIGSGAEHAIVHLMTQGYSTRQSLERSIYQIAEAKYAAEIDQNVGGKTAFAILLRDEKIAIISGQKAEALRQIWDERPRFPLNLEPQVRALVQFVSPGPVPVIKNTRKRKSASKKLVSKG